MHVYGRDWWSDAVNYGSHFGALEPGYDLPGWGTAGGAGRRAALLQQIQSAVAGVHTALPRPASASSMAEREAAFWGLASLWEDELVDALHM